MCAMPRQIRFLVILIPLVVLLTTFFKFSQRGSEYASRIYSASLTSSTHTIDNTLIPEPASTATKTSKIRKPKPSSKKEKPTPKPAPVKVEVPPLQTVEAQSIRPIAYVFPQFHPIPENDAIWGINFTEWDNVRKVTANKYGLPTLRPSKEVGMYNMLDFSARQRQGKLLRDHGFLGAVYHHYWFSGKPVMDGVLKAILADGEPRIPFMLSWANEPWTSNWDGDDRSKTYIAQDYGSVEAWRQHFEWLLPYFRHPLYIRSPQGRVQFVLYKENHATKVAETMFNAWRQWALEEGLGGLDIIETRWGYGGHGATADAVNEFHPNTYASNDHARYRLTVRSSRIYHRGTSVCFDNTPRHATDGSATTNPLCHPDSWENYLVNQFERVKSDPNPIGTDNYFFVNALNEWGEGNAFEDSVQWQDRYAKAMKNALAKAEEFRWRSEKLTFNLESQAAMNADAEVCILVRTFKGHSNNQINDLSKMLQSLYSLDMQAWRALVFETDSQNFDRDDDLDMVITQTLDPRLKRITVPDDIREAYNAENGGYLATDWVIEKLAELDPKCASARYLLVTNGDNVYTPTALSNIPSDEDDIDMLGLNFETRSSLIDYAELASMGWDSRCDWISTFDELCRPSKPTSGGVILAAILFKLKKFKKLEHSQFSTLVSANKKADPVGSLAAFLINQRQWTWQNSESDDCHVYDSPSFTMCREAGNFWLDSPISKEVGCYSKDNIEQVHGDILWQIDWERHKLDPFCLRYNETQYNHHNNPFEPMN